MGRPFGLSPREVEVVDLLVGGKSTNEIAAELFVSLPTVSNHAGAIMAKTGTHSRLAAVAAYLRSRDSRGHRTLAWCESQGMRLTDLQQILILQAFLVTETAAAACIGDAHQWPPRRLGRPWTCLCGAVTAGDTHIPTQPTRTHDVTPTT